jgi:predicted TIM-barrel fold metal-dependent hydrolase
MMLGMAGIIDTNIYLSRWPFRRVPGDEPTTLVAKLRSVGVTEAWAGSFDALLHRDIGSVNQRTAEECKRHGAGVLVPVGSVNPMLPDWQEDIRRCHEVYRMPAIRLHPNYHGYKLDQPLFTAVLDAAMKRNLIVQLAVQMEDERTQHPLLRIPPVVLAPLAQVMRQMPGLKLQLLNHARLAEPLPDVRLDLAMVEGVYGVKRLIDGGESRVLFGSYYPFFPIESALGKVKESGIEKTEALYVTNARRFREVK